MKTPEQMAQEYAATVANGCSLDQLHQIINRTRRHFLAGHAAGKQDAERRIWELCKQTQDIAEFPTLNKIAGAVSLADLNHIIFGGEKV